MNNARKIISNNDTDRDGFLALNETEMHYNMSPKEIQNGKANKANEDPEQQRCDYCGADIRTRVTAHAERRKYCSANCQKRASQGRMNCRLTIPMSKRYATRMRFSNPLYFD